jgi:hypothetical protein
MDHVEGSTTSKTEKETADTAGDGHVDPSAPTKGEREGEKSLDDRVERDSKEEGIMITITGLTENLSGNRSSRAGLKEGADVAVVE